MLLERTPEGTLVLVFCVVEHVGGHAYLPDLPRSLSTLMLSAWTPGGG